MFSDILHAFLGLAALSLMGEEKVEPMDPSFCMSLRARENLRRVPWWND